LWGKPGAYGPNSNHAVLASGEYQEKAMPTTAELKRAFRRSSIWRLGWTFDRAMACQVINTALCCMVRAQRRKASEQGKPMPDQGVLI